VPKRDAWVKLVNLGGPLPNAPANGSTQSRPCGSVALRGGSPVSIYSATKPGTFLRF